MNEEFDKWWEENANAHFHPRTVWEAAWNAALEKAAKVAETTICDTHIPTGVDIYGSRAAKNIRALACSPVASDLMKEE